MSLEKASISWSAKQLKNMIAKAVENGIDADMMADWLVDFFGSHSEEYDIAAGNGSAKNSNIVTRDKVLSESFEQFFTEE